MAAHTVCVVLLLPCIIPINEGKKKRPRRFLSNQMGTGCDGGDRRWSWAADLAGRKLPKKKLQEKNWNVQRERKQKKIHLSDTNKREKGESCSHWEHAERSYTYYDKYVDRQRSPLRVERLRSLCLKRWGLRYPKPHSWHLLERPLSHRLCALTN